MMQNPDPGIPEELPHGNLPRYCLHCRCALPAHVSVFADLPRCPTCGLPFDPLNPASYTNQPMFLRWRNWLPVFVVAVVAGVANYAFILYTGSMGYALFFSIPFSVGAILGYAIRPSVWLAASLSVLAIFGIVCSVISLGLSGMFCGITLGFIFIGPTLVGLAVGAILRLIFYNSAWDERRHLVMFLLAVLPLGAEAIENLFPHPTVIAEVRTSLTFEASPRQAWDSIVFYEEVEHDPPWLLTLALPKPVRAEGSKSQVGDRERCIYKRGYIVKEITACQDQQLLGFRVNEQHLHFEHDMTLKEGSFTLQSIDPQHTRVVLTTRYERHLSPAWLWEPMERKIIHTLHGHVLEGMRRCLGPDHRDDPSDPGSRPVEIAADE